MNIENFTNNIIALISKNDLKSAIEELGKLLKGSPKLDELILQSARFNEITQQIRLGTVDFTNATITQNKIRRAILDLVNEIEIIHGSNPELKMEMKNSKEFNSKIIIKQTHAGKGDNIGRDKNINQQK